MFGENAPFLVDQQLVAVAFWDGNAIWILG
jgi:hypothetical protein